MKEIIKKIRNGVKEFFKTLAAGLIDEEVYKALKHERDHERWLNDKATIELLKTVLRWCPENHFVVLSTDGDLFQGLQETRNVMRAHPESAFVSGRALTYPLHTERPITEDSYETAYAINPSSIHYFNNSDEIVKDIVKCLNGENITYFEYAKFI